MWLLPEKRLSYLLKKKLFRGYQTKPPRVRFAPSPTGHLHLGGLRTALYNYLFAKSRGGAFILRIEDTDQARKVAGAVEAMERDLQWAGLQCDEGPSQGGPCAPYVQSERLEIYQAHAERLVEAGAAYRCFCSARRLAVLRRDAERAARPPRYDGRCRALAPSDVRDKLRAGTEHCIRFKLTSAPECQSFEDLVYGRVAHDAARAEGDPVLLKTDGWPTYHLAAVVDDRLMAVTHVLRGVEWQISTTKHLLLYKAFGWEAPRFGHLPLIVNADGAKLSKRQHDATVAHYRDAGVLPLALVSFLALAGGGFPHAAGAPVALRTLPELAREFQLERVSAHPTRLNAELLEECGRLELQRQVHDAALCGALADALRELVGAAYGERARSGASRERLCRVLRWGARRVSRLHQLLEPELAFLWASPGPPGPVHADDAALVAAAGARLAVLSEASWEPDMLRLELQALCEERGVRWPALARTLRGALAGQARGPPVPDMLALLGRAPALDRLRAYALPAAGAAAAAAAAAGTQASPDAAAINTPRRFNNFERRKSEERIVMAKNI